MNELICHRCATDNVLVLDEAHRARRLGFDRYICPNCEASYPEQIAIEMQGWKT